MTEISFAGKCTKSGTNVETYSVLTVLMQLESLHDRITTKRKEVRIA